MAVMHICSRGQAQRHFKLTPVVKFLHNFLIYPQLNEHSPRYTNKQTKEWGTIF